jgi:prepilin-type N-terminal cleavage/methylation domain-containing protein
VNRPRGFTLIEVLTSLAIGLALCVLATSTFFQVRSILRRTQARLELHNTARFLFQSLRQDLMAMQQEGAFYLESIADTQPNLPPGDPGHTGEVRLTFLRGRIDNYDYVYKEDGLTRNTDLVWTQWKWVESRSIMLSGSSSHSRRWDNWGHWVKATTGQDFGNSPNGPHSYLNFPQPRRVAGVSASVTLNDNNYQSGNGADIGDYDDLQNNLVPAMRSVTNLTVELVLADGSTVDVDTSSTKTVALDGVYIDGRVPTTPGTTQPNARRPRLLRLRVDLTDTDAKLTQSFSFSIQLPSNLPAS